MSKNNRYMHDEAPKKPDKIEEPNRIDEEMNAYALTLWNGQSPSLKLIERVTRIKAHCIKRGYENIKGLELPAQGYKKYLG